MCAAQTSSPLPDTTFCEVRAIQGPSVFDRLTSNEARGVHNYLK